MKYFSGIFLILFVFISNSKAQGIEILSIAELNAKDSTKKILLLSADWCAVCKKTHTLLEKSETLDSLTINKFKFYEFNDSYELNINFNDSIYHFQPQGLSGGYHQFNQIFKNEGELVYPSFLMLSESNIQLAFVTGYLSESEWVDWIKKYINE